MDPQKRTRGRGKSQTLCPVFPERQPKELVPAGGTITNLRFRELQSRVYRYTVQTMHIKHLAQGEHQSKSIR